jgi:hypothetical protein
MEEPCVPRYGTRGALACTRCARRKARCSHVATTTPSTDAAEWTAAMREGAERVAEAVDRQTEVFGAFIEEIRGLKTAVERLSSSSASSSRGASSVPDAEGSTTGDEDEGMEEDEEMGEASDRVVRLSMGGADDGSSDAEKDADEGGSDAKGGDEHGDDEGSGENENSGDDKEGSGVEEGAAPEASTTPRVMWRTRVSRPQARMWKGKGKGKM